MSLSTINKSLLKQHIILYVLLFLFITACGSNPNTSQESLESGAVSFKIKLAHPATAYLTSYLIGNDICIDYGVATVTAIVKDSSGKVIASGSWPCSAHQGIITGIPAGNNYTVNLQGKDSDNSVTWSGEKTGISISRGTTTSAGIIAMAYVGSDAITPTVTSTTPSDIAPAVPVTTLLTATFSEKMALSSVNSKTFALTNGTTPVSGSVTYDSNTKKAIFIPAANLSYSTTYTATITTGVEDMAGNNMQADKTWSFTTEAPPSSAPSVPTGVSATAGNGQATITWDAVTGATSYNIYWSTTSGITKTTGTPIQSVTSPYIHTGRNNGTTYYYVVTAVNVHGESDTSAEVPVTPAATDTTPPTGSVIINNNATYTNSTTVTLTLSATDSSGISQMCISNENTCPSSSWETYTTSKSWTLTTGDGTKAVYSWFKDGAGNVNSTSYKNSITLDTTAPSNTTGSNFINSGALSTTSTAVSLTISATDNVGVVGYYASESSNTPLSNAAGWTSVTPTTFYLAGVTFTLSSGDGTKTVYVWFKDAAGNVSSVISDSIIFGSLPSAPSGVTATAGAGQVTVSWNAVSGATSYNIYWSTTSGVTKSTGTKISDVTTPYPHTGRTFGTTYYYVVAAVNTFGESDQSSEVSTIAQAPALLPKTGQTACFNDSGNAIACAGTGQDGDFQRGVVLPNPRFLDNGDNTITDNLTGLIWTKDANLPNSHMTWQQALDYVAGMNAGAMPNFGHTDWRLPNNNELESLIDAGKWAPALPAGHPFVLQNNSCWSSTAYSLNLGGMAWGVDIGDGFILAHYKSENGCVWPVRSGEGVALVKIPRTGQTTSYATCDDGYFKKGVPWPTPRFRDNGDSTVTDNLTGLMWTKLGGTSAGTWQQVLNYVAGMNAGIHPNFGYTDWRLPNRKELRSLVDYSNNQVALPSGHPFSSLGSGINGYYWTSTSFARDGYDAWLVAVGDDGSVTHRGNDKNQYNPVWPVRGGI